MNKKVELVTDNLCFMWVFIDVKLVVQKKPSTDVHVVCGILAGILIYIKSWVVS